jgi:hypothetical protein
MRNLRRFCTMLILVMALASAALADGPVNCPGIIQQPLQGQSMTAETSREPDGVTSILLFFVDTLASLV